jgi:H+/gluconate symporter-like permease
MVAGFIALLNVALIMAVVEQRPVLPFAGVTRITVGGVVGGVAIAFLSGSPHPVVIPTSRSAVNQIL